jgi:hypothetical protein
MVEKKAQATTDIETNWFESVDNFNDLNLNENLLRGIYGKYFEFRIRLRKTFHYLTKGYHPLT